MTLQYRILKNKLCSRGRGGRGASEDVRTAPVRLPGSCSSFPELEPQDGYIRQVFLPSRPPRRRGIELGVTGADAVSKAAAPSTAGAKEEQDLTSRGTKASEGGKEPDCAGVDAVPGAPTPHSTAPVTVLRRVREAEEEPALLPPLRTEAKEFRKQEPVRVGIDAVPVPGAPTPHSTAPVTVLRRAREAKKEQALLPPSLGTKEREDRKEPDRAGVDAVPGAPTPQSTGPVTLLRRAPDAEASGGDKSLVKNVGQEVQPQLQKCTASDSAGSHTVANAAVSASSRPAGDGTEPEAQEENWESDITPGQSGYHPCRPTHFQRARHKSHRERRRMYREQTEQFKRQEAERLAMLAAQQMEAAQRMQEEEIREQAHPETSLVPVPVEEIEARVPWREYFPAACRADTPYGTAYPHGGPVTGPPLTWPPLTGPPLTGQLLTGPTVAPPGWPMPVAGQQATPVSPGTVVWVPYGTQVDPAPSVLLPAQPAPGHQFVLMQVPAMGVQGPGAAGEGMVSPYPVPAPAAFPQGPDGEPSHYLPEAPPVWVEPSANMAYGSPVVSDQPQHFWIPNPAPFVHPGFAAPAEQIALEQQVGAPQPVEAVAYVEGVPPHTLPEGTAVVGEEVEEHAVAEPEVTPACPPPQATATDGQSTTPPPVLPSSKQYMPPPQAAATTATQPDPVAPSSRVGPRRAEEDAVAAFLRGEWTRVAHVAKRSYYNPAKARNGRRAL